MSEPAISASGEYLYQRVLPLFVEDEQFGWFGRHLCDAIMAMMGGLDQIVLDSDINPGWTSIADPETCPEAWLPWCAQLLGVVLPPGLTIEQQRTYIIEHPVQKRGTPGSLLAFIQEKSSEAKLIERENPNGEAAAYWFQIVIAANHFDEAINTIGTVTKGSAKVKATVTAGMEAGAEVFMIGFVPGTTIKEVNSGTEFTCTTSSAVAATGEGVTVLNPHVTADFTRYVNSIKAGGLKWVIVLRSYNQVRKEFTSYTLLEAAYSTYSALEIGP